MLDRAAASRKNALAPAYASVSAADIVRAPTTQKEIPLDLAPILKPYKRKGKMSLRVEGVPQRARLSAGRNNGDGSWSLASDELEDLTYQVPSNMGGQHNLSIRIMSLAEADASTLKVITYPVSLTPDEGTAEERGTDNDAQEMALPSQLGNLQSLFAARESDVAALRAELERVTAEKAAELAAARTAWETELQEKLAAASHAKTARISKADIKAEMDERLAQEQARWKEQAQKILETERQRWKDASLKALSDAEVLWKTQEAARLTAALAEEQQRSAGALAEAETRWKTEAGRLAEAMTQEQTRSKDARSEAQTQRQADEASRLAAALAEERQRAANAVSEAEARWKSEEAVRLNAAVAQEQQRLAEAEARWKSEEAVRLNAAVAREQQRLAEAQAHWKSEEATRLSEAVAQEQQRAANALAEAEASWQAEETTRMATALVEEQQRSSSAMSADESRRKLEEAKRLAAAVAQEQQRFAATLAEAEALWKTEAAQRLAAAVALEQARLSSALAEMEARWKSEEAARTAQALAARQTASDGALAQATDKCRQLEAALAEVRAQKATLPIPAPDHAELDRLRQEVVAAKTTLATREEELARERLDRARLDEALAEMRAQQAAPPVSAPDHAELDRLRQEVAAAKTALAGREEELARERLDRARIDEALSEARAQKARPPVPALDHIELDRLRQDVAAAKTALAARDEELVRERADRAREHDALRRKAQAGPEAAIESQQGQTAPGMAGTLAAAEAKRQQLQADLDAMTERCKVTENFLEQAKSQAAKQRDDGYIKNLRREITELRASLASTEQELTLARNMVERSRGQDGGAITSTPRRAWGSGATAEDTEQPAKRGMTRELVGAACLAFAAVLAYPYLQGFLPDSIRENLPFASSAPAAPEPAPKPAAAPAPERPSAMVKRAAKLRSSASTSGTLITTLKPGASVAVLDTDRNWTLVEVPAEEAGAKPVHGWVYNTYLDGPAASGTDAKNTSAKTVSTKSPKSSRATTRKVSADDAVSDGAPAAVEPKPQSEETGQ